jgi:penicillin amidase
MSLRSTGSRVLLATGVLCAALALMAVLACSWVRSRVRASLPRLDGAYALRGLAAPVSVARDALGVPTITGSSRTDVARATGWIHAQDRFFQMDTLRRRGAGELSELFGREALPLDKEARMHGFRELARKVLARESPGRRALVEAYADGVNQGLADLAAKPWEYAMLRADPRPWKPEDSVLITYAMTLDLQESTGRYVRNLAAIRDVLGRSSLAFFAPVSTPGDAPLDGSVSEPAPIPPSSELDLRVRGAEAAAGTAGLALSREGAPGEWESPGSNCFAVGGALAGGAGMVANDMHLHLSVPNIWYHIRLKWPGHDETGVMIPGAPMLVAGSTGKIAWGFTNSNAGVGDVLVINPSISPDLYHGPEKGALVPYEHRPGMVPVKGSRPEPVDFKWTTWGPVVGETADGHVLVFHWTEDDPAATNLDIVELEDASDAQEAVSVSHHMGIPAQNFIVADRSGQIAWTVAGLLPRRIGYDGRLPVSWAFEDRRWEGFLPPGEVPTVASPSNGLVWSANNRSVGGKALAALGDSGYAIAARARQIRDDLTALSHGPRPVAPRDLLGIQLDDRAELLGWWRDQLLSSLGPSAVAGHPSRSAVLQAIQKWEGKADTDSASYRVVREFRLAVAHRALDPIFAPCVEQDAAFSWSRLNYEQPLETLLRERPAHLLEPSFKSWDELVLAAVDDVSASYDKAYADPRSATWGQYNTARIEHPFALVLPGWASRWLAMPDDPLPGDDHMPRVQSPVFGASERFVVSPGREEQGIFEMPGGECANPYSPYFRAGHEAWVHGEPAPFLPGPAEHTLALNP